MIAKPYSSKLLPSCCGKASGSRSESFGETDAMRSSEQVAMVLNLSGKEQTRQRRAHQIGEGSTEQCAKPKACDHRALVGREAAGHRHLNGDRAEIGKAAERKRDD